MPAMRDPGSPEEVDKAINRGADLASSSADEIVVRMSWGSSKTGVGEARTFRAKSDDPSEVETLLADVQSAVLEATTG